MSQGGGHHSLIVDARPPRIAVTAGCSKMPAGLPWPGGRRRPSSPSNLGRNLTSEAYAVGMSGYAPITPRLGGNCGALPPTICSVCLAAIAFLSQSLRRVPAPNHFCKSSSIATKISRLRNSLPVPINQRSSERGGSRKKVHDAPVLAAMAIEGSVVLMGAGELFRALF